MASDRSRFPADYFIEALQGRRRPNPSDIRRALAPRAAWLQAKILERAAAGLPTARYLTELAAIAQVIELVGGGEAALRDRLRRR